ncbi:rpsA, partial [Symbiodinium natans]
EVSKDFIRRVEDVLSKGQEVSVRVLSVDVVEGKMMLSMKAPASKESSPFNVSAFEGISPDAWMSGKVVHTTEMGAFVRLEHAGSSADGFLHSSELGEPGNVRDVVPLGENVRVRIIKVNVARNRMKLSMLPFEDFGASRAGGPPVAAPTTRPRPPPGPAPGRLVEDLKPFRALIGQWLPGVVKQLRRNGVQVAVVSKTGAYAVGMVFLNQIQEGFVNRLEDVLSPGQEVKVQVLAVNLQGRSMTLSMKGGFNYKKQDVRPFEGVSATEWFPGTVEKVKGYGAFVTVRRERSAAEGLVRLHEMVGAPASGDEVEVRVLGVDVEKGSMRLSMRPPSRPEADG